MWTKVEMLRLCMRKTATIQEKPFCVTSSCLSLQYLFMPMVSWALAPSSAILWQKQKTLTLRIRPKTHGTALNTGLGGGLTVDLSSIFKWNTGRPIMFDASVTRIFGGNSSYRHIKRNDEAPLDLNQGMYNSATEHLDIRFGVTFGLN